MTSEQKMWNAGRSAEEDARWHIDREMKIANNWRGLHDILLWDRFADGWCQIDHLVFSRLGHFLVLETKSAKQGMELHEPSGAFCVMFNGNRQPVRSPIAQNQRHIQVLQDWLAICDVMPKRGGLLPIEPTFENWVLVEPGSPLPKKYDGARLVQRDQFTKAFDEFIESIRFVRILKLMLRSELSAIAKKLAEESKENRRIKETTHLKPEPSVEIELAPIVQPAIKTVGGRIACSKCKAVLTPQEYGYCKINFSKLGKRFLCKKCQKGEN